MPEKAQRTVAIHGLPVFAGSVLTAGSPEFDSLRTAQEFVRFARLLRGQFCIVIEEPDRTIAISDFGGSRPVYYWQDPKTLHYKVSSSLADLVPFSRKKISREAIFFYSARRGAGISPFYIDIHELHPATVGCFAGGQPDFTAYLDWQDFLEVRPIEPAEAERRFIEIASSYLSAIVKGPARVGCLLSGGTDSALIAWLLQSIGADQICFTADYVWNRYSEYSSAASTATCLGLGQQRVLVQSADRRRAFSALNSAGHSAPCCDGLSPVVHQIASAAVEQGISTLVTGDHADSLFLGFDRFFRAFPREAEAYSRATESLNASAKLALLYPPPGPEPRYGDLLSVFGYSTQECMEWEEGICALDRKRMSYWADHAPLHTLQQLSGQMWAGISWKNLFLPVTQAHNGAVEFVSPFYDLEMIRFAMSLPIEFKFRNGTTKTLLRDVLKRVTGRSIVKRASPNPARLWRLIPDVRERRLQGSALQSTYDSTYLKNVAQKGNLWQELDQVAALGIWLSTQPLDPRSRL